MQLEALFLSSSLSGGSDRESGVGEESMVGEASIGEGRGSHSLGDILDGARHQVVQRVLSLLKLNLLGISWGGSINRLKCSSLVSQGLLDCGGDSVSVGEAAGVGSVGVATIQQLGGSGGESHKGGDNNQELHDEEILYKTPH